MARHRRKPLSDCQHHNAARSLLRMHDAIEELLCWMQEAGQLSTKAGRQLRKADAALTEARADMQLMWILGHGGKADPIYFPEETDQ